MTETRPNGIYCVSNPWFRQPGTNRIPYKIGEGFIRDRFASANNNTWVPDGYVLEFAKLCDNSYEQEQAIHAALAEYHVVPSIKGVKIGTEWYVAPLPDIRDLFEKVPGEWWMDMTNPANVQTVCLKMDIVDSHEYARKRKPDWLEQPWESNPYAFFHPKTTPMTEEVFAKRVFEEEDIRDIETYTDFASRHKQFPSRFELLDGYFGRPVAFPDLLAKYKPSPRR